MGRLVTWMMAALLVAASAILWLQPAGASAQDTKPAPCGKGTFAMEAGQTWNLTVEGWMGLGIKDGIGGVDITKVSTNVAPSDGSLTAGPAVKQDGAIKVPLTSTAESEGHSYTVTVTYTGTVTEHKNQNNEPTKTTKSTGTVVCEAKIIVLLKTMQVAVQVESVAEATVKGEAKIKKVSPDFNKVSAQAHTEKSIYVAGMHVGEDDYRVTYVIGGSEATTKLHVTVVGVGNSDKTEIVKVGKDGKVTVKVGQVIVVVPPGDPAWFRVLDIQKPPDKAIADLVVFKGGNTDALVVKGNSKGKTKAELVYKQKLAKDDDSTKDVDESKEHKVLLKLEITVIDDDEGSFLPGGMDDSLASDSLQHGAAFGHETADSALPASVDGPMPMFDQVPPIVGPSNGDQELLELVEMEIRELLIVYDAPLGAGASVHTPQDRLPTVDPVRIEPVAPQQPRLNTQPPPAPMKEQADQQGKRSR